MEVFTYAQVADLAAALARTLQDVVEANPRAVIGWPSGRSTVPLLDALGASGSAAFDGCTVVMMDDYAIPVGGSSYRNSRPDDHYSCWHWVESCLLPALSRDGRGPRVVMPDAGDPDAYERLIDDLGGVDVFLAGVGASDAHIAFNPPGTDLDSRTRVVALADTTRRDNLGTFPDFRDLDEVPNHGVTVGLATIAGARRVIGIAHGANKAGAVRSVLEAGRFVPELPASVLYVNPTTEFHIAALDEEETL